MILSSGDEDPLSSSGSYRNDSFGFMLPNRSGFNRRNDSHADAMLDDDEEDEDDDDDDDDDPIAN